MGFITIDDRDVNNYFSLPIGNLEVYKQWLMGLKADNPTSKIDHLGQGRYQLNLPIIECTASDVNTRFNIPYMHQLLSINLKHTNALNTDSSDDLDYSISKRINSNLWMKLLNIEKSTASDIKDEYIDYYMELGDYLVMSNTTNTDKLWLIIKVKITGV